MNKKLQRILSGTLAALFVGQVMIYGDGNSQGIAHAETIKQIRNDIERAQNADELASKFDNAIEGLGEVDYFSNEGSRRKLMRNAIVPPAFNDTLTVTGFVQRGNVSNSPITVADTTPIYVRIFNGNWEEISSIEISSSGGSYTVSASGSDVYHVKYECDGYLPFYLKDFGTGTYQVGSGNSTDTVILLPGDTTYNQDAANRWSDDNINENDLAYVQSCEGAYRGDSDYNPTMDVDGDGVVSQDDLDEFCSFYEDLDETEYVLPGMILNIDVNRDAVINDVDREIFAEIVKTSSNPSGYVLPDLANNDGVFTTDDLDIFNSYLDDARVYESWVYLYNHEMTGDIYVNADDFSDGIDNINSAAQKRARSANYYEYMDKDSDGDIDSDDSSWFNAAYTTDVNWDYAFKRSIKVLENGYFPYSLNLHDTNLDLNGNELHVEDCMSFTTDVPSFWSNDQGAVLDINGGYLEIMNNLVFRTASPDGWTAQPRQKMLLNGGSVYVGGDFNFGQANCYDEIIMTNADDVLMVCGNWIYITLADMEGKWTNGTIYFLGPNWNVNEASGPKSIYSSGTQSIVFFYPYGRQTILWDNPTTYINEEDGSLNTNRRFNFDYENGLVFPYGYSELLYWFRPWWRTYDEPDYTIYRKAFAIGDGVHIATGNYTKSFTDLSVTSPGVKSDFVRTYNSMNDEEGSFGIGWDFNIDVSKIVIPAYGYYQVVLPDGSNTTFKDDGNGGFECMNAHSKMEKSGNEYTITNSAQSQYHFNAEGQLDFVKDANGNKLEISSLNDNYRYVTDSTGRRYSIHYVDIGEKKRIDEIIDNCDGNVSEQRSVSYQYNENAQLVSANSVSGGTEYYEYDRNGRLCKIINCYDEITDQITYLEHGEVDCLVNASGLKQEYVYDKANKQTGLKEYDGNTLVKTFAYNYDEKYAVKKNTVETDGQTYEVDKITYSLVDGKNKYDEMSESIDIMGNTTSYERDTNGNVTKTINPDDSYTLVKYNSKNMPIIQADESGNVTIYKYDSTGVNVEKKYQSLRPVNSVDNFVNNFSIETVIEEADYAVTVYTYYPPSETGEIAGLIRTITEPEQYVTEYIYGTSGYSKGLPVTKLLRDNNTSHTVISKVEYEYNSHLQVSKETTYVDITNNVVSVKEFEYDDFNNVTKISDFGTGATAAVTITDYDLLSRKTAEYAPNYSADRSHGTTYTYYPSGAVKTQTDALDNTTSFVYDAYGNTISRTNPDGTINITEYDGLQREKATYFKPYSDGIKQILTSTSYDFEEDTDFTVYTPNNSRIASYTGLRTNKTSYITSEKQVITSILADFRGNSVEEKTNNVTKRTNGYYENGQLARQMDALNNTTEYEYSYLNKLTKTTAPFSNSASAIIINEYDKNGRLILTKQSAQAENSTSPEWLITENQYNAWGKLSQVTSKGTATSDKSISRYFYNNAGIQTKMHTGLSSENDTEYLETEYTYDAWMRLVTTSDSTGYNSGNITYDLNGNVLTSSDANGNITTNTYDALNRVLTANTVNSADSSKNVSKSYTYDNMGRLTSASSNGYTTSYVYDRLGRKSSESEYGSNYSVFRGFFYEGVSNYLSSELIGQYHLLVYSNKNYEYDSEMRLSKVKESGNEIVSYTYDANGNKLTETLGNGVVSTYTYNNANRITGIITESGNSTISEYEYSYYLDGSDACKMRSEGGIIESTSYEYDGIRRLVSEAVSNGNITTDTYAYEYDDYGNRSKMTATGSESYVTEYSYTDTQDNYKSLLLKETKTEGNNVKVTSYTYDANGNQLTKTADGTTKTNTYDGLNQLIGFTDGTTTASYAYNVSGLRVEKIVNGQRINHVWDGSKQIIADIKAGNAYEANCYIRGTNLAGKYQFVNGAKTEYVYYVQNAHGDVVDLTDANGAVTKVYRYDAFGVEKNTDSTDTNAFRYCGEYFDSETGTIYLRARHYDPSIGRFISRDSFAGKGEDPLSLNLYTYCQNNPIIFYDPSGHLPKWVKKVGDWGKEFIDDAITSGKSFANAQNERFNSLVDNPSLFKFADYMSYGYFSANKQRYEAANNAYGYANWALSGIPDMVKGAFKPDRPFSFQHFVDSFGTATFAVSAYTSCVRGKVSPTKNTNSSVHYSCVNIGPLDQSKAETFRNFSYTKTILSEDTVFYRVYGGKTEKVGRYMTRTPQYGGAQSQIDLALNPAWGNTAEYVTRVTVPKGTVIYEGAAAPQIINGGTGVLIGGGNQVYIPEVDENWFS